MNIDLVNSMVSAPRQYASNDYLAAQEMIKKQRGYVAELKENAKASKSKSDKNAAATAQARLDEMEVAFRKMEAPKHSSQFLAAMIIAEYADSLLAARSKKASLLSKMAEGHSVQYVLQWNLDDLVASETIEAECVKFFRILMHQAAQLVGEQISLGMVMMVVESLTEEAQRKIMRYTRRLASRSTSIAANLVEDMDIQALSNMYDDESYGGGFAHQAKRYQQYGSVQDDSSIYAINLQPALDLTGVAIE